MLSEYRGDDLLDMIVVTTGPQAYRRSRLDLGDIVRGFAVG